MKNHGLTRRELITGLGGATLASAALAGLPATPQAPPGAAAVPPTPAPALLNPRRPGRKNVLAWGDVQNGYQHNSVTHAFSVLEALGYHSQLFDLFIRTDDQPISKTGLFDRDGTREVGLDLNDYDAILFFGIGEINLSAQQRAELLSFVHDDGKGFVGVHSTPVAFVSWPEFGEMIGGRLARNAHPWGITEAPIVVEDRAFPASAFLPPAFLWQDEMPHVVDLNRSQVDVLLRLDARRLPAVPSSSVTPTSDLPLAWVKTYGQGRVYCSALGHPRAAWDAPAMQRLTFEALKWALKIEDGAVAPHPQRSAASAPVRLPAPPAPSLPAWAQPPVRRRA